MKATQAAIGRECLEAGKLLSWRAEVLLQGNWAESGAAVLQLVEASHIDYRQAIELRDAGCPAHLAFEILF